MTPEKNVLWIEPRAYGQLKLILELPTMIVGLGEVVEKPDGYHLTRILVPGQESYLSYGEITCNGMADLALQYYREGGNLENLRLFFRSSTGMMSVPFFSGTDERTINNFYQFSDYGLLLVGSIQAMRAQLEIFLPRRQTVELPVNICPGAVDLTREEKIDFIGNQLIAKINGPGLELIAKFLEKLALAGEGK